MRILIALLLCGPLFGQALRTVPPVRGRDQVGYVGWQLVGVGPLASLPATCTANQGFYVCNGAGCPLNGGFYYCTATDTWASSFGPFSDDGTTVTVTDRNVAIGPTLPDAALGGVLGGWNKYTVTFANNAFKTADTAVSIVLGELPANGRIEELVVDHAAFAGTGITSFTCSLGDGTNHTIYAPALNLFAAAGTSVTHQDGGSFSALKAAHNLTLRCTANVNVGDGAATVLTAGSLDIWLKVSVLQ
jgi:hypothetical protein